MQPIPEKRHIEATPGTCGGKPRIAGHRIRVQDVVIEHDHWGLSPEEIVAHHPGITLADVHAALTHYHDHRKEIQRDIEDDRAYAEQFRKDHPDTVLTLSLDGDDA